MGKLFDRLAARMGYEKSAPMAKKGRRAFDAGLVTRLTASWGTSSNSMNQDIYRNLRAVRSRSRDLCYNNPYALKFLKMSCKNIVGPTGFTLQVKSKDSKGTLDQGANTSIQNAFYAWAKRGVCDVTGKLSFCDIKNLVVKATVRDGEAMIRKVYGHINKYGFALQVLDIDRLDIERNEELANGNIIKMGVEITKYGRPVAYHLLTRHPGDTTTWTSQGSDSERVLAEDVYHIYIPDRPEQTRGIPWMHSAMLRLHNIGAYEEAAIINARVGASKMGFVKTADGDGSVLADAEDDNGELLNEVDAGQIATLPPGADFTSFNPDYPHAMFAEFMKAMLRGVAAGLDVAYNTLAGDLENVNFSSIRSGTLEERDSWMVLQNWFIESFLDDVFSTWLKFSLLNGAILLSNGSALPITKYDKFNQGQWQGRRWQWVDPRADVEAAISAIDNGLKSRTSIISEMGGDITDVWEQLQAEQKMAEEYSINLPNPNKQKPQIPPPAPA